ncbi:MAG: ParB N-terminal domain-containing protein [Nitrososphaerota archaeon]|jgi:ParB/RepB/Spo0J family partition protein|nr:ParB N-terminal domain-containing protein [Nitrososphaerota archaeon]MDG7036799.1 ParB N-terminal domain-containing protein [Nitrososphaerota archaeon]MDG7039134.1 ParB N-terminal domain-containing protein [Nitrososphaerota archaeon]
MESDKKLSLKPTALGWVSPENILPNPNNPRILFPEDSLLILKESIKQVGILVPLVVYQEEDKKYHLLDGERRWRCAKELNLTEVPVNIVEKPTTLQNIITMFNIHKLREDWELMPTALKLEALTKLLKEHLNKKRIGVSYLSQITGLPKPTVQRCKILISYDKKYQDLMLAQDEQRVKTDFFTELYPVLNNIEKGFPEIVKQYSRNDIIDKLLDKYRRKVISDVIDLREVKTLIRSINKGVPRNKIYEALLSLINEPSKTIKESYTDEARSVYKFEEIDSLVNQLITSLETFKPANPEEEVKFAEIINKLILYLKHKLVL